MIFPLFFMADWGVQAIVSWLLSDCFHDGSVSIVAEEDDQTLSSSEGAALLESVVAAVNGCLVEAPKKQPLRVYSMVKYAAIARGDAEIFMKFARAGYKEKIWDHATSGTSWRTTSRFWSWRSRSRA